MKTRNLTFLLILSQCFFYGCEQDNQELSLRAKVSSHSSCKVFKSYQPLTEAGRDISAVTYRYVADSSKMVMRHINAGFNCCPETLSCTVGMAGDTIIIREMEEAAGCHCKCLFDLVMEIMDLEAGKYYVKIVEPYCGDQEKLHFSVDLESSPQGEFCVKRNDYPWGF